MRFPTVTKASRGSLHLAICRSLHAFTTTNRVARGMRMRWTIAAAGLAACLIASAASAGAEPIELQWWHAMTSVNADRVNKIAAEQE